MRSRDEGEGALGRPPSSRKTSANSVRALHFAPCGFGLDQSKGVL